MSCPSAAFAKSTKHPRYHAQLRIFKHGGNLFFAYRAHQTVCAQQENIARLHRLYRMSGFLPIHTDLKTLRRSSQGGPRTRTRRCCFPLS
ncbi:MAG: hypothetical protein IPK82_13420 [Polyangiaceae bacterium]|nr:hypothetical protein [Polyangiaceae bacterium]